MASVDGVTWTAAPQPPAGISYPAVKLPAGYLAWTDSDIWSASVDGTAWVEAPELGDVITRTVPNGNGSMGGGAVGDALVFQVADDCGTRDLWIVEFEGEAAASSAGDGGSAVFLDTTASRRSARHDEPADTGGSDDRAHPDGRSALGRRSPSLRALATLAAVPVLGQTAEPSPVVASQGPTSSPVPSLEAGRDRRFGAALSLHMSRLQGVHRALCGRDHGGDRGPRGGRQPHRGATLERAARPGEPPAPPHPDRCIAARGHRGRGHRGRERRGTTTRRGTGSTIPATPRTRPPRTSSGP